MNSIAPEGFTEVVQRRALSYPAILSVYLFGSQSTGKAKPDSDLYLAILLFPGQENDFPLLELTVSLEKALNRSVDLFILNRAGELLKYQVRRAFLVGSILEEGKFYPFSDIDGRVEGFQGDYFKTITEVEGLLNRTVDLIEGERCRFLYPLSQREGGFYEEGETSLAVDPHGS